MVKESQMIQPKLAAIMKELYQMGVKSDVEIERNGYVKRTSFMKVAVKVTRAGTPRALDNYWTVAHMLGYLVPVSEQNEIGVYQQRHDLSVVADAIWKAKGEVKE